MARQLIKMDKLLEKMNQELVGYESCVECRFKSIVPLVSMDQSGCNWSHANLTCRGYPAVAGPPNALCRPGTFCQPLATRVITEAKNKYNVW